MSAGAPLVVHVVDDDASFLTATARLLRAQGFVVKTFGSATELLAALDAETRGCIVADLRMPGVDGLALQDQLARGEYALPVVFLSGQGDIPSTVRAIRHGAEDFLTKTAPKDQLVDAVARALARGDRERAARDGLRALRSRFARLTAREHEVLAQVVRGRLNKQIASDLGIHERTVKLHRTSIMAKLEVDSVAELTRLTVRAHVAAPE